MSKRELRAAVAVGLAVVLAGGVLYATNMAFKFNHLLSGVQPGVSLSGNEFLSLPYVLQSDLKSAGDLRDKIDLAAGEPSVISISRWDESSDFLQTYTGTAGTDFALGAGEGYLVQQSTADVNFVVTGAHDPFFVRQLSAPGPGSLSGTNFFAFPYHGTPGSAAELRADINHQAGGPAVVSISRFVKSSDSLQTYTGAGRDFPLTLGEAYLIQVRTSVPYVPSTF